MLELAKAAAWDVVIVGAGPAGLSAALVLGRCRRRVLLTDSGTPRSAAAHRMHGFLSRDGIELGRFRASCREKLRPYANVTLSDLEVTDITGDITQISRFGWPMAPCSTPEQYCWPVAFSTSCRRY